MVDFLLKSIVVSALTQVAGVLVAVTGVALVSRFVLHVITKERK